MKIATDQTAAISIVIFMLAIGAVIGWGARKVSTRDKVMIATVERHNAERDYYNAEFAKLKAEYDAGEIAIEAAEIKPKRRSLK